jgi:ectoine hydroxylase-related dioxygenase (phytanoyl-CoA dioxygenase family)
MRYKFDEYSTQSLSCPWIESDFAKKIIKKVNCSADLKKKAIFFIENGYCIIKGALSKNEVGKCLSDFNKIINSNHYKKNPTYFHYNKHPRVIEGWKQGKYIKNIVFNKKIINLLNFFYKKKPVGISTINFTAGTEQPLHSDYVHFASAPELYLAGVWFAFEKVDKNNGPLVIVPKSHKLQTIDFPSLNLKVPKTTSELKKNYTIYEDYLKKIIKERKLKKKLVFLEKGDAIIWAANLLHGGTKIKDKKRTRLSQVVHYHFEGLKKIYNPCFSDKNNNIYALRNLDSIRIK